MSDIIRLKKCNYCHDFMINFEICAECDTSFCDECVRNCYCNKMYCPSHSFDCSQCDETFCYKKESPCKLNGRIYCQYCIYNALY